MQYSIIDLIFSFLFFTTVGNKRYNKTRACNRHMTVVKRLHLSVLIANCQEDLRYLGERQLFVDSTFGPLRSAEIF